MENNVPLIESIVSRASDILKLRFLDGSVGEIVVFDDRKLEIRDGLLIVDGREISSEATWSMIKFL